MDRERKPSLERVGVDISGSPRTGVITVEGPFHVGVRLGGTPSGQMPNGAQVGDINVRSAPHGGSFILADHDALVEQLVRALERFGLALDRDETLDPDRRIAFKKQAEDGLALLRQEAVSEKAFTEIGELAKKATQGVVEGAAKQAGGGLWFAFMDLWSKLTSQTGV